VFITVRSMVEVLPGWLRDQKVGVPRKKLIISSACLIAACWMVLLPHVRWWQLMSPAIMTVVGLSVDSTAL
jgi:hypothetical protein